MAETMTASGMAGPRKEKSLRPKGLRYRFIVEREMRRVCDSRTERSEAGHGSQSALLSDRVGICDPSRTGSTITGRSGRRKECADLTRRLYHIGNICQGLL